MSHPASISAPRSHHDGPPGDRVFVVAPEYAGLLESAGLDSRDALFNYSQGESLTKPGLAAWRERIRLTLTDGGPTQTLYMKRFTHPPASARREVRRCGNGARSVAGVEWNWLHAFRDAEIPCAEPIALGEEFVRGRERRSVIIMASVPGRSLEGWAREWTTPDRDARAPVLAATADLVAKLHALGCVHRDLYLSHVFLDPAAPAGQSLRLIDLQRVFRPTCRLRRWIVKDLAAFYFSALGLLPRGMLSRADALRWLKRYLGAPKLDASAKRLAYRIIGRTRRLMRRRPKAIDENSP